MDVTSYLLGKQAGGGSTPTLQNKSVEITENGTTNVTADTGYDGLSQVEVTTNVSGGADLSDYFSFNISKGTTSKPGVATMIKNIPSTITVSGTSLDYAFSGCGNLQEIPYMDTSNVKSFYHCFYQCYGIKTFPVLNFSKATDLTDVWNNCNSLTDTSLDNILQTLISATSYTGTKTLANMGYWVQSIYPASRIQALPHYQDFVNAGWTIGY